MGLKVFRYYAGVARIERRFSNGYSLLGTYTWARAFNNYPDGGSLGADIGFKNIWDCWRDPAREKLGF
jgi:hypothetical protein